MLLWPKCTSCAATREPRGATRAAKDNGINRAVEFLVRYSVPE